MGKASLIGAAVVGIMAASLSAGAAGTFKCEGGNACKGQGGCKTPKMAKKHAATDCKGHSFVMVKDAAACTALKGADAPAAASEAPKG
jgi:hypothetical protein